MISMTDGKIEKIGWLPLGGYRIGIRSPHGGYFYYAHLASYEKYFQTGEAVEAGQILGFMGDTGLRNPAKEIAAFVHPASTIASGSAKGVFIKNLLPYFSIVSDRNGKIFQVFPDSQITVSQVIIGFVVCAISRVRRKSTFGWRICRSSYNNYAEWKIFSKISFREQALSSALYAELEERVHSDGEFADLLTTTMLNGKIFQVFPDSQITVSQVIIGFGFEAQIRFPVSGKIFWKKFSIQHSCCKKIGKFSI